MGNFISDFIDKVGSTVTDVARSVTGTQPSYSCSATACRPNNDLTKRLFVELQTRANIVAKTRGAGPISADGIIGPATMAQLTKTQQFVVGGSPGEVADRVYWYINKLKDAMDAAGLSMTKGSVNTANNTTYQPQVAVSSDSSLFQQAKFPLLVLGGLFLLSKMDKKKGRRRR